MSISIKTLMEQDQEFALFVVKKLTGKTLVALDSIRTENGQIVVKGEDAQGQTIVLNLLLPSKKKRV